MSILDENVYLCVGFTVCGVVAALRRKKETEQITVVEHFSSFNLCNVFIVLLVIVSSCPDGEFSCTSEKCVPAPLVCDFKEDCEDGSDEEFCGMIVCYGKHCQTNS